MEKYKLSQNPYKEGTRIKRVVDLKSQQSFARGSFQPFDITESCPDPYRTLREIQEQTGQSFSGFRIITANKDVTSANPFIVYPDGVYERQLEGTVLTKNRVSNFSFSIIELCKKISREGTIVNEIKLVVQGHNEVKVVSYEDYGNLSDFICKTYPECHVFMRAAMHEFAANIFRNAQKKLKVTERFTFHGWYKVKGVMRYLSTGISEYDGDVYIPKIPRSEWGNVWAAGVSLLDVGQKVFNESGEIDRNKTLHAILPLFFYLHLGFAAKLFEDAGESLQFLLLLTGKSGSLKTSVCQAIGEPFNQGKMLRFESTPRALELYRESCVDMTMVVDDIFAQNHTVLSKFENILRAYGDGIGRAKSVGKDFSKIERTVVRGGCIVTAEHSLNSQQSSALRFIEINLGRDSFNGEALKRFQEDNKLAERNGSPSLVQSYFGGWISFLEENYESIVAEIPKIILPEFHCRFKRHGKIYSQFGIVAKLILNWGVDAKVISNSDAERLFNIWIEVIQELILKNQAVAIVTEPWQQVLEVIQQALGTGVLRLASDKAEFEAANGKMIGYRKGDKYIFSPGQIMMFVRKDMEDMGRPLIADNRSIFKDLYEAGIALGYENQDGNGKIRHRYLRRVKLHGQLTEMLFIESNAMNATIEQIYRGNE